MSDVTITVDDGSAPTDITVFDGIFVAGGGGGGAVDSVNTKTGAVVLVPSDIGAQPVDSDLTAIAALTTTTFGRSLLTQADAAAARTTLGAGTSSLAIGTTGSTAAAGNDSRLSDARTPTAHASSHASAGSDPVTLAASQIGSGTVGTARLGSGTADSTKFLRGDQTWAVPGGGGTVTSVTAGDSTITVAGTSADPTIAVNAIAESKVTNLVTDLAAKQPLDSDLTTLAGLTATTDNFIQAKSSAWASRTPAQVAADLALPIAAVGATINAQTGTSYTLVLSDGGKWVTMTNASASTLTVPPNSSVAFPVGTLIEGAQLGAGQVTLTQGAGVTINADPGKKIAAQYGTFGLLKTATDTWLAMGRLSA